MKYMRPGTPFLYMLFLITLFAAGSVHAFSQGHAITPQAANAFMENTPDLVILDVRNSNEYEAAHYPGALLIPLPELETRVGEIPAGRPVLIHCAKGVRAEKALPIIKKARPDLTDIVFIKGVPEFLRSR